MFPQQSFGPRFGYPPSIRSSLRPAHHQPNPRMGFYRGQAMPRRPMFNARQFSFTRNPQNNKFNYQNESKFYCETCDRGFKSEAQLNGHKEEHAICGIDGCAFKAHFKVVDKHIQMQHHTGLYDKIKKLATPEDVKKWREERRKNFPTKEKIEEKKIIEEEKQKRGERIPAEKKRFGNHLKDRHHPQNKRNKFQTKSRKLIVKKRFKNKENKAVEKNSSIEDERSTWNGNLPPFKGTKDLYEPENNESGTDSQANIEIEDEEWETTVNTNNADDKSVPIEYNTSLKSLMCAYMSDDYTDDDDEQPVVAKISRAEVLPVCDSLQGHSVKNINLNSENVIPSAVNIGTMEAETLEDLPEDKKNLENEITENEGVKTTVTGENCDSIKKLDNRKRKRYHKKGQNCKKTEYERKESDNKMAENKRQTLIVKRRYLNRHQLLLRKLLNNEIKHERNVVLQCIRYILNNDFFVPKDKNKQNTVLQCIQYIVKNDFFGIEDKSVDSSQ